MRNCIDEGTLQAWFDGELDANAAANVVAHLNACVLCAKAAQTVERESLILSQGLSAEFSEVIPAEHLRQLIETAVAGLNGASMPTPKPSRTSAVRGLFPSFRVLAYGLTATAVLVAGFLLIGYLKKENPRPSASQANPGSLAQTVAKPSPETKTEDLALKESKTTPRPRRIARKRAPETEAMSLRWQESQYEYAFVKLNEAIKSQAPMRPSLQVQYEYDLALIDNAIATTRDVARKHPKDPQATQSMLAAYQSKVDLMNQVAIGQLSAR
jgi:hypothetical protein